MGLEETYDELHKLDSSVNIFRMTVSRMMRLGRACCTHNLVPYVGSLWVLVNTVMNTIL
jgi:hypothetical protein